CSLSGACSMSFEGPPGYPPGGPLSWSATRAGEQVPEVPVRPTLDGGEQEAVLREGRLLAVDVDRVQQPYRCGVEVLHSVVAHGVDQRLVPLPVLQGGGVVQGQGLCGVDGPEIGRAHV